MLIIEKNKQGKWKKEWIQIAEEDDSGEEDDSLEAEEFEE